MPYCHWHDPVTFFNETLGYQILGHECIWISATQATQEMSTCHCTPSLLTLSTTLSLGRASGYDFGSPAKSHIPTWSTLTWFHKIQIFCTTSLPPFFLFSLESRPHGFKKPCPPTSTSTSTSNVSKLRCISFQSSTNFLGLSWWLVWWPLLCVKSYFCPLRKGKERFQDMTTDNQLIIILGICHLSPHPIDQECHFPVHPPCQVTASIQALQHPFDELDAILVERDACQEKWCCYRSPSNQLLSISLNSESEGKVSLWCWKLLCIS